MTYEEKFKSLAERYCRLLETYGVNVIPYRDPSLPGFRNLPVKRKVEIIRNLDVQCSVFSKEKPSVEIYL